jgi:hypothetical protein
VYDFVWNDNRRRHGERTRTWDLMHKFNADYRLIFVGDATMSPFEILRPGGSLEHMNEDPGADWLKRLTDVYQRSVWLNPTPEDNWDYHYTINVVRELMGGRMFPLTLDGLDRGMRTLTRKGSL